MRENLLLFYFTYEIFWVEGLRFAFVFSAYKKIKNFQKNLHKTLDKVLDPSIIIISNKERRVLTNKPNDC